MAPDQNFNRASDWQRELPVLKARTVTLREPVLSDVGALVDLLSLVDATHFGMDDHVTTLGVQQLIDRVVRERAAGLSFTYAITMSTGRSVVGLIQVRQLDAAFETAEWECTITPSVRGTGVFFETARLVGSLTFGSLGTHRLETRVPLQNGRANGALRKLGAVQEGILRRSTRQRGEYVDQVLWAMLREDWGDQRVSTTPRVH